MSVKLIKSATRITKRMIRRAYPVKVFYPDWNNVLGTNFPWKKESLPLTDRPRILFANVGGHSEAATLESLLAVALSLRGARVDILLCDEVLPACERCGIDWVLSLGSFMRHGPKKDACPTCFAPAYEMFKSMGVTVRRYSEFLSADDFLLADRVANSIPAKEIGEYAVSNFPVGEHALAGALRFYARGDLNGEVHGEAVLRRYLKGSLLTASAISTLFDQSDYSCVVAHHGIYVPQGLVGAVARQKNVRVVNWTIAYRKQTFIFSHGDTYHHTMMSEPVENWEGIQWTHEIELELMDYLKSRWDGSMDWISFNRNPENDLRIIAQDLGIDFAKPCVGLLTNVIWDAQLHYPSNVFHSMIEWLLETIRYFASRPDLQLIVRVHPAEVTGAIRSRQLAEEEIKRAFSTLPRNVFIIPPNSPVSTYATMLQCNAAIIYGTKTGIELTSLGIPVIVAGEAWIRNKGITLDATSVAEYTSLLDRLPFAGRLSDSEIERARKYAYHFFFRRMIPLENMVPAGWPRYVLKVDGLDDLLPGKDPGLDVICDGIMRGAEFIYPAERLRAKHPELPLFRSEAIEGSNLAYNHANRVT
ncbi:hypothetical protein BH18ACI4_BH18ACI4_02460 [soil metagenome]